MDVLETIAWLFLALMTLRLWICFLPGAIVGITLLVKFQDHTWAWFVGIGLMAISAAIGGIWEMRANSSVR